MQFVFQVAVIHINKEMNQKNSLYPLEGGSRAHRLITPTEEDVDFEVDYSLNFAEGLCVICENRNHCVWVENKKIYCEHYE